MARAACSLLDDGPRDRDCRCARSICVPRVVALPFGIAIGWLLARKDFWGKTLLDGIVYLPLVLPPVVTGYLLLISFGRRGADRRLSRPDTSASCSRSAGPARRSPAASWAFR